MDDAYAAGLIDGEGCLTVGKRKSKNGTMTYEPFVLIDMTVKALPILRDLHAKWKGYLGRHRKSGGKWAESWSWKLYGPLIVPFLTAILPHLRLKDRQAKLLLQLEEMKRTWPRDGHRREWPDEMKAKALGIRATVMDLNRKGPPEEAIPEDLAPPGFVHVRDVGGDLMERRAPDLFDDTAWQPFSGPFGNSAIVGSFGVLTGSILESPSADAGFSACSLAEVLETESDWLTRHPGRTSAEFWSYLRRYFLSARAAAGILRRAKARGRDLPPALDHALRSLAGDLATTPEGCSDETET